MDANGSDAASDRQVETVQDHLDVERERVGDTLEALAYKTDVGARASEAISTGVDAAKSAKNVSPVTLQRVAIAAAAAVGLYLVGSLVRRSAVPSEEVLETVSAIDEGAPDPNTV